MFSVVRTKQSVMICITLCVRKSELSKKIIQSDVMSSVIITSNHADAGCQTMVTIARDEFVTMTTVSSLASKVKKTDGIYNCPIFHKSTDCLRLSACSLTTAVSDVTSTTVQSSLHCWLTWSLIWMQTEL